MSITVNVNRDAAGTPTGLIISKRGRKVEVQYYANKMKIKGRVDEEIRDIIKLFYPYEEKEQSEDFSSSILVEADAETIGAGITVLYTVPAGKKMKVLIGYLTVARNGAGNTPTGQLYAHGPNVAASFTLDFHRWTWTATDEASGNTHLDWWLPEGWYIATYSTADTRTNAGFVGVLKDA